MWGWQGRGGQGWRSPCQNSPKDLELSYKTVVDVLALFCKRKKYCSRISTRLIYMFKVIV